MATKKEKILTGVVASIVSIFATLSFSIFTQNADGKILGITKAVERLGVSFSDSVSIIHSVNLKPLGEETCFTDDQGEEYCCENFSAHILVDRFTDRTLSYQLDQKDFSINIPTEDMCINLDPIYNELLKIDDEMFTEADVIIE